MLTTIITIITIITTILLLLLLLLLVIIIIITITTISIMIILLSMKINTKGWNSQAPRGFPGKFESSNVSRDNISREIGRNRYLA